MTKKPNVSRATRKPPRKPSRPTTRDVFDEPKEFPSGTRAPRDAAHDSHGSLFVRMLNTKGLVRGVVVDLVGDRLMDGYRFIVDEPATPRFYGNPNECDRGREKGWKAHPRQCAQPGSIREAHELWYNSCMEDRSNARLNKNPDLNWNYLTQIYAVATNQNVGVVSALQASQAPVGMDVGGMGSVE